MLASEVFDQPDPSIDDAVIRAYLSRIERLGRKLHQPKTMGSGGPWQWQLDLLKLQREIQQSIAALKEQPKRDRQHDLLEDLRVTRWHSRRLGDALVWTMFAHDRKRIASLSENTRSNILPEGHGSRGMLALASHFINEGEGFPLFHDITDSLRIGDLTLIKRTNNGYSYRTIEVKTSLLNTTLSDDGSSNYEYIVNATWFGTADDMSTRLVDAIESDAVRKAPADLISAVKDKSFIRDARAERQFRRLDQALGLQLIEDGVIGRFRDRPYVSITADSAAPSYWEKLRRVVRRARRSGYAFEVAENGILYVALYNAGGLDAETAKNPQLIDNMKSSSFFKGKPSIDSIVLNGVPAKERLRAQIFLPFFLYPIPQASIYDLLHGRLAIIVIINPAWIRDALHAAGFITDTKNKPGLFGPLALVRKQIQDIDGNLYWLGIHGLAAHVPELIHEFMGAQHLVNVAHAMHEAGHVVLQEPGSTPIEPS